MAKSIKLKNDTFLSSSGIIHNTISNNFAGRITLENYMNYAQQLPPGDASTGSYWQKIPAGLWVRWRNTTSGDAVTNTPFDYGYYLVLQTNLTGEPLVYAFDIDYGTTYVMGVNWNGDARWGWQKISTKNAVPVTLYESETGTSDNITTNDNPLNYERIGIYYTGESTNYGMYYTEVLPKINKNVCLNWSEAGSFWGTWEYEKWVLTNTGLNFNNSSAWSGNNEKITTWWEPNLYKAKIFKIVGYK